MKGQRLQVVGKFTYLGSTLSRVVHIDEEVNTRIAKASVAFGQLRGSIWDRSGIRLDVYISKLIRFARASSNLYDFNYRNKALTAKLLRQCYRYFKPRKAFSKFYRRHSALVEKYSVTSAIRYIGTRILR